MQNIKLNTKFNQLSIKTKMKFTSFLVSAQKGNNWHKLQVRKTLEKNIFLTPKS